jgi:hypothetical protein
MSDGVDVKKWNGDSRTIAMLVAKPFATLSASRTTCDQDRVSDEESSGEGENYAPSQRATRQAPDSAQRTKRAA